MGWKMLEQVGRNLREQRFHCGYALREKAQNAGRADEALQTGALIEEHGKSEQAQTPGVGKGGEEQLAEECVSGGPWDVAFDLGTRVFDELVVLHAGGAGRHTGHAAEAIVHVQAKALVEWSFARCWAGKVM